MSDSENKHDWEWKFPAEMNLLIAFFQFFNAGIYIWFQNENWYWKMLPGMVLGGFSVGIAFGLWAGHRSCQRKLKKEQAAEQCVE